MFAVGGIVVVQLAVGDYFILSNEL